MSFLREESSWTEPIYLIERHDPLMGGEYGINNIQARQLANRTRYLLEKLLKGHAEDGSHSANAESVAANAAISERKLRLDYPTAQLASEIDSLAAILKRISTGLERVSGLDASLYGPLYEALRLSWRFGYPRFAFELFNSAFSLRKSFPDLPLLESVSGDDSIDVVDSAQLVPGETCVLWDREANRAIFATTKEILTDHRVILFHDEQITRRDSGVLAKMSWVPCQYGMRACAGSKYVSGYQPLLKNISGGGFICVAHTGEADFVVEILRDGASSPVAWERIALVEKSSANAPQIRKSIYRVPGCGFTFRITALNDCVIDHLALVSENSSVSVSPIRAPEVVDSDFTIVRFGALYGIKHAETRFELSRSCDFSGDFLRLSFGPDQSELPVWDYRTRVLSGLENLRDGAEYWWRACYLAEDGSLSPYSGIGHYIYKAE